jgi:hypothetical protein
MVTHHAARVLTPMAVAELQQQIDLSQLLAALTMAELQFVSS